MGSRVLHGVLCLALACVCTACTPVFVGPTAVGGYVFRPEVSTPAIWLGVSDHHAVDRYPITAEVLVHVQDGQGRPVDGVVVDFAIEPLWAQSITLTPAQAVTRNGMARALLAQPQTTGRVRLTARVDQTTAPLAITVQNYVQLRSE